MNSSLNKEQIEIVKKLNKNFSSNETIEFQAGNLKEFLKAFAENNNIAFNKLMKIMRGVLSGLKVFFLL